MLIAMRALAQAQWAVASCKRDGGVLANAAPIMVPAGDNGNLWLDTEGVQERQQGTIGSANSRERFETYKKHL